MNPVFWTTLGYDPADMPHKMSAWKRIVNEEVLAKMEKSVEEHLKNPGSAFDEVIRYSHKKGHTVWIRCKGVAIRDEDGKPVRMLGTHTDISDQVRKEKFLERFNSAANIGYWELDVDNELLYWSDTVKKIHDLPVSYKPELYKALVFYAEGESRNAMKSALRKAREKGLPYDLELQLITAKGRTIWVRTLGYAETFNGKCARLYGSLQDVDEQKRSEIALKESKNQFQSLVENIPGATYQYTVDTNDKRFKLEYISEYVKEITGYSAEDFQQDHDLIIRKIIHEDDLTEVIDTVNKAVDRREGWQVDYRILHKNGSIRWINERGNVFATNNGADYTLIGVMFDQTDQVKIQVKLAKEKKLLRTIIDNVPVNIYMKDKQRRKILANKSEVKYSGFEIEEEVLGKTDEELYPGYIAKNYTREDRKVLKEGISLREMENDMGNGRWAIVSKIPIKDNEGNVESIVGISIDITERKKAEQQLNEALIKLKSILAASTRVGIVSTDPHGLITSFNRGAENLLGYSAEELIGTESPLTFHLKKELKNRSRKTVSDFEIITLFVRQTKFETKEWELVRKDGSTFPAQLTITEIRDENDQLNGYLA